MRRVLAKKRKKGTLTDTQTNRLQSTLNQSNTGCFRCKFYKFVELQIFIYTQKRPTKICFFKIEEYGDIYESINLTHSLVMSIIITSIIPVFFVAGHHRLLSWLFYSIIPMHVLSSWVFLDHHPQNSLFACCVPSHLICRYKPNQDQGRTFL